MFRSDNCARSLQCAVLEAARPGKRRQASQGASDNQEFLAWRSFAAGAVELIDAASLPGAPAGPNSVSRALLGCWRADMFGCFVWRGRAAGIQQPAPPDSYSARFFGVLEQEAEASFRLDVVGQAASVRLLEAQFDRGERLTLLAVRRGPLPVHFRRGWP